MSELPASCREEVGIKVPVIDKNRCEAKAACVVACPFEVFDMRTLRAEEKAGMSLLGRMKLSVHGGRQAIVARPEDCHACGLCVSACPEKAIRLVQA